MVLGRRGFLPPELILFPKFDELLNWEMRTLSTSWVGRMQTAEALLRMPPWQSSGIARRPNKEMQRLSSPWPRLT